MLEFDILEKKCKAYRRKKFVKFFSLGIGVVSLVGGGSYFIYNYQAMPKKENFVPHVMVKAVSRQIIKPIKNFKKIEQKQELKPKLEQDIPKKRLVKKREHNHTVISSGEVTLVKLQEIFAKRHTYDIAIKIAKKYFKKHNYKQSLVWAKKANSLNKEDEASWMLYAKSRYALGNVKSAKEILHFYLNYKNSKKAKLLLEKWNKQ
jgi:tetratricopeptide (TPR) repeat protein